MKSLLPIMLLVFCASCVAVYVPTPHSTPMFSKKNEFQAGASAGVGLHVRTAYSATNHLGITASYLNANNRGLNKALDGTQWRIHNIGEVGIGYYTNNQRNRYMDLFAGAGWGKGVAHNTMGYSSWFSLWPGEDSYNRDRYDAKGKYYKIYLQPAIGWRKKIFSWNASLRFTYLNFTDATAILNDEPIKFGEKPKSYGILRWRVSRGYY